VVTPISPYLRLPFKIFNHYINEYGLNRALVVEADADLTNMDLATLHALHMSLKNISEEEDEVKREFSDLTTKDRERILESVEEAFAEAFNAYTRGEVS
jgi:ATP-dependent helicase/DNAse subunit B